MSQTSSQKAEFGKWRTYLWPVHNHELKKLIPMLLIFFLITCNYNILRTMKDTLVVTAKSSGAEVIPFIKVWVMFPGAIFMTFLFTVLSNRLKRETVFYVMISIFLTYFFLFAFVLYPTRHILHPNATADFLQTILPPGFKGIIAMFRNWTFTIFYAMSELWGNIILFVLFWGFANQVTRINEAKRFYGLFGIGANLSGIAAGQLSVFLGTLAYNPNLPFGEDAWGQSVALLVAVIVVSGILTLFLFRWLNNYIRVESQKQDEEDAKVEEKISVQKGSDIKGKLSLLQSFNYLIRSKYLMSIALVVISYNLVINLVEVVWKNQVHMLYPNPSEYNTYVNQVSTVIGVMSTLTALFISGNSIRKCGWTFTAMITPAILFATSLGFFSFFFLEQNLSNYTLPLIGATPLAIVVFFGSAQNVLSRSAKYSVFDATKEMAFVPLSPECKLKGKAAIDGICSRLGKSGGSVIHQSLLLTFSTVTASAPYVAAFLFAVIVVWMAAVRVLGKQFVAITSTAVKNVPDEVQEVLVARKKEPLKESLEGNLALAISK